MSERKVFVDSIEMHAADIHLVAGRLGGSSIGDLVRRADRLIQVSVFGQSCFLCAEPRATEAQGKVSWEPLCRSHGFVGERISDVARNLRIDELVESGASPDVVAAYFNFAIKRSVATDGSHPYPPAETHSAG